MTHPTDRVQDEDLLYAWSEEELSAEEAMRLRRMLADDPELGRERDAIEELRDEVRSLPRGVEPGRDLWPGLKARLQDEPRRSRSRGRILPFRLPAASPAVRWATALAAVLVMAVGLTLARRMESPAANPAGAALAASEAEYLEARREVLAQLDEPGAWSSEVVAVVNANLEVVDRSVREVEVDLARNADDPHLRLVLADRYRSQAELLRNLQRRSAGI